MLPNRRKQINANIAQSVECSLGKAEVTGSIPVVSSSNVSVRTFYRTDDMKINQ